MASRSLLLFASQISRESRRIDSTVIRVIYLVLTISILWSVKQLGWQNSGLALLRAMTVIHSVMAVVLAVRLAGDIAGNRSTGLVGLLALAGVPSRQAVLSHLLLASVSFLSVWLIRAPILCLAFHLGGTTWNQILHLEALLLGIFAVTYCAGLLLAHYSEDRTTSRIIFLFPAMTELILSIPSLAVATAQYLTSWNPPLAMEEFLGFLRNFRTTASLHYALSSVNPSPIVLCPLILQSGIALWCLWAFRRIYYARLDEADGPPPPENRLASVTHEETASPSPSPSAGVRPNRPVWDDALAWQAFQVHSDGKRNLTGRSLVIACVLICVIVLADQRDAGMRAMSIALLTIATLILMFLGRGKVSDCLQREIKGKTLPALLLTPHNSMELVDGWSRGARKLMQPDLVLFASCLLGVLLYGPNNLAPIIVSVAMLLQASEPFFVLSPLVPFSIQGIATGLGLIAAVIVMLMIAAPLSVALHPWAGPIALVPLVWGWNRLCRRMIPRWFEKKQDEIV